MRGRARARQCSHVQVPVPSLNIVSLRTSKVTLMTIQMRNAIRSCTTTLSKMKMKTHPLPRILQKRCPLLIKMRIITKYYTFQVLPKSLIKYRRIWILSNRKGLKIVASMSQSPRASLKMLTIQQLIIQQWPIQQPLCRWRQTQKLPDRWTQRIT